MAGGFAVYLTLDAKGILVRQLNLTIMLAAFVFSCGVATAADWNAQYSPTRKEWLELTLSKRIAEVTDLWEKRIGVNVVVFQKEETIAIVLAAANGQVNYSSTHCANYSDTVRKIADDHVKQYPWARGAKIEIRCA